MAFISFFFVACQMQRKYCMPIILGCKTTANPSIEFIVQTLFRTTAFIYSFELKKLELLGNSKISKLK
jgi:hypothetical protein